MVLEPHSDCPLLMFKFVAMQTAGMRRLVAHEHAVLPPEQAQGRTT